MTAVQLKTTATVLGLVVRWISRNDADFVSELEQEMKQLHEEFETEYGSNSAAFGIANGLIRGLVSAANA